MRATLAGLALAMLIATGCGAGSTAARPTTTSSTIPYTTPPTTTPPTTTAPVGFDDPVTLANAIAQNAREYPGLSYGGDAISVTCTRLRGMFAGLEPVTPGTPQTFDCTVERADHSGVTIRVGVSPDGSQWGTSG